MINSSDMKRGVILDLDGAPWQVIDCAFHAPTARGASTLTKVKIRNLVTGQVLAKTWRSGDVFPEADCERRKVQCLYKDGEDYVFMDLETYEQYAFSAEVLKEATGYLLEGMELKSLLYNGSPVSVELPKTVELVVAQTDPAIKGATAQAQQKQAVLETGLVVLVPPYLTTGETISVDTSDGRFVGRVSK